MKAISLPVEHGGYLTAAGAAIAAALVAPRPVQALLVGTAFLAAFLARAAVERWVAAKPPARWDGPWLGLLALAILAPAALLAPWVGALTATACAGLLVASNWVRQERRQRDAVVEALGMAALGLGAGWAALTAGVDTRTAAAIGLVLATHAALAVPLVRTELRRRERERAGTAAGLALAGLAACGLAVVLLGRPVAALALLPRVLHAVLHGSLARYPASAAQVGLRETVGLGLTVALLVA